MELVTTVNSIDYTEKDRDRFVSRISFDADGCWRWTGKIEGNGYGRFYLAGRMMQAHRVALLLDGLTLAPGLDVDHFVCENRSCVNPAHLRQVTRSENMRHAKPRRREEIHPKPVPASAHGTHTGYRTYGCRCDGCAAAGRKYNREYWLARKATTLDTLPVAA